MRTAEAIKYYGSQKAVAKALGIKQPSVAAWGEYPPITRQYQLQVVSGGKLRVTPIGKQKAGA